MVVGVNKGCLGCGKNASDKIQSIHNHKNNYRTWINDKEKLELRKKYISNGIITLN